MTKAQAAVRLDVGCGAKREPGWVGMDGRALPGVDIVHDIEDLPWPVSDNSCSIVQLSHVWEHIKPWFSIPVMDELWRVLAPGGQLWLVTPYGWSHGYVMDPTHCNPANEDTWNYFTPSHPLYKVYAPKPWRKVKVESQRLGNMFAVLEPIEKTGPVGVFVPPEGPSTPKSSDAAREFHIALYDSRDPSLLPVYAGRPIDKSPLDLWRYIEAIEQTRPEVLIECGTANGASAKFFLDQMKRYSPSTRVISIDVDDGTAPFSQNPSRLNPGERPKDEGITYLIGDSVSQAIVMKAAELAAGSRTMVVLDSSHAYAHVRMELIAYAPLVSPGCLLVVEDVDVNGHPVYPDYGPGPYEAVAEWLPDASDDLEVDEVQEMFLGVTSNRWLRRRA